jgi:glycosyltransferase involved in cell wall biosynthesis
MKILFANASIVYPPNNGPAIHRYQLVRNLIDLGHEVTTLKPDQNPLPRTLSKMPWSVLRAVRWADAIYARPSESPDASSRLTSPWRRWVVRRHTAVIWEQNRALSITLSGERSPEQIQRDIKLFRRYARRVDAAIGVAPMVTRELRDLLGIEHAVTIQNGSDPDLFRPDLDPPAGLHQTAGHLQVVWIGGGKNIIHDAALIEGLGDCIDARSLPMEVHVIGDTRQLFRVDPPRSLIFHGPISYLELPRYLAAMDVGLAVYRRPIDGGSALKLFDYMAAGCAPICSPGESVEDAIGQTGAAIVRSWTPQTLTAQLLELHQDRPRLKQIGRAGRQLIERRYNWAEITRRVSEVIEQAVDRRRRAGVC